MDNFTLVATLNVILGINIIFTFITSGKVVDRGIKEWRLSSVFLFAGFFLLMFQKIVHPFFTICTANYFILLGFYYQTEAALYFETRKNSSGKFRITLISAFYWLLFLIFTFIRFSTPLRIIIISLFLVYFYLSSFIKIGRHHNESADEELHVKELYYLFIISALYYSIRVILTLLGLSPVKSLFDRDFFVTVSLLYPIIYTFIYFIGMSTASLSQKNSFIRKEKDKLNYLFDFLNDTAKHLDLNELYQSIEDVLRKSLGVKTAAIFLADNERGNLKMAYGFNDLDLPQDLVLTVKKGEGAAGRAFEQDKVVEIDINSYPNKTVADSYKSKGVTSLLSAPLKTSEGIIGAITVINTGNIKSEIIDKSFLYYLGEQIGLVLHNAFLYQKVIELANVDPLTGLFNRRKMLELFELEIKRARRSEKSFTIAMADIDNFKRVNDSYGHECGDEVLKSISSILRNECRESDYICRWGGEEFLLLFIDADLTSAKTIAERIRKRFAERKNLCMDNFATTLSMGITEYKPDVSLEHLLKDADSALYMAKENGKNRVEYL